MFLDSWDKKEKDKERKEKQTERIGKFLFVGACSFLVVYIFTLVLESIDNSCLSC